MTDDDPKPGVVIDVAPLADRAQQADKPPPAQDSTQSVKGPSGYTGTLPLAVAIATLLAVGAAITFGYLQLQALDTRLAGIESQLEESRLARQALEAQIADAIESLGRQRGTLDQQQAILAQQQASVVAARSAFEAQEQRLADESLRLQAREAELRATVADVHRRVGRSGTQWIIAETEYLLRIAGHRLSLARDTGTALMAMQLADQRLRDTRNPAWTGVREQIARDIAMLSAYQAADVTGLSARLGATIDQVPSLRIAQVAIGPERRSPEKAARDPQERSWDTLFDDLWSGLKDSVRIRKRDEPVAAMLAPEHQFFLYENLKLQLEAARLALVRGDPSQFRENLETASNWVSRYFAPDAVASAIGETLVELRTVDIQPPLPDVSQSLHALQVHRQLLDKIVPQDETAAAQAETP